MNFKDVVKDYFKNNRVLHTVDNENEYYSYDAWDKNGDISVIPFAPSRIWAYCQLLMIANYYNSKVKEDPEDGYEICYEPSIDKYQIVSLGDTKYSGVRFQMRNDAQAVIDNPNFRKILDKIYKQ